MSKETTKARIQEEITTAIANNSITPVIVGSILDEILELPVSLPYKVISGLISQSDFDNPTLIILENTFGNVPVTASRGGVGQYVISGGFDMSTFDNSICIMGNTWNSMWDFAIFKAKMGFGNVVLHTGGGDMTRYDNILDKTPFEIRVYN
jgi:hypothetical protein